MSSRLGTLALIAEGLIGLDSSHLRITRMAEDVFRQVAIAASIDVLEGEDTRRAGAQQALNMFADVGITGFVDRAGRNWDLASYAEMAVRSTAGRAAVQGHVDRLQENGRDLVIVSAHGGSCPLCQPHEGRVYSLSGEDERYPALDSARDDGLFHSNCVVGETLITGPRPLASFTRWYEGELVIVHTAGGIELSVTPNHPILTPEGWVAAGLLVEGDKLVRYDVREWVEGFIDPDDIRIPTAISEIARTVGQALGMSSTRMPVAPEDFHGDGEGSEVAIVRSDSFLSDGVDPEIDEPFFENDFVGAYMRAAELLGMGALMKISLGSLHATDGIMSGHSEILALVGAHPRQARAHSFASVGRGHNAVFPEPFMHSHLGDTERLSDRFLRLASQVAMSDRVGVERSPQEGVSILARTQFNAALLEPIENGPFGDSERTGDCGDALSGQVAPDDIVGVERKAFNGHVYNLQTTQGWFACNGIITHNCRHSLGAYVPGLTESLDVPARDEQEEAFELSQEQRYSERQVRHWKRRDEVALTPNDQALAGRKVAEWQARTRQLVEQNDLQRRYDREQITSAR